MNKIMSVFLTTLVILSGCASPFKVENGRGYSSTLDVSVEMANFEEWDLIQMAEGARPRLTHESALGFRETAIILDDPRKLISFPTGFEKSVDNISAMMIFFHVDSPHYMFQITKEPHDMELGFTQKKLSRNMSAEQVGDLVEENIFLKKALKPEIISNQTVKIGGGPGYKIFFTYESQNGKKFKVLDYGFHRDEWFYSAIFIAPDGYKFEQYLD